MLSEKARIIGAAHVLPGGGLTYRQQLVRDAMRQFAWELSPRHGIAAGEAAILARDVVRLADAVLEAMAQE